MKRLFLISVLLISLQSNAQWTGAIMDSLTHNNLRDELSHQCIDIDQLNTLHVVYSEQDASAHWNVYYQSRILNSAWSAAQNVTFQLYFAAPVIAASIIPGEAFIAYEALDTSDQEIYLCSNAAGSWTCLRITNDTLNDTAPTIAVDSSGYVHLAWICEKSSSQYKIKYATNRSGSWVIQELTGSQLGQFGSGAGPEIAVDKSGNAHIAYRGDNGTGYHIHHAYNNAPGGTTWNFDYITTPNDEDLSLAIQVDKDTAVHLLVSGDDGFGFPVKAFYQWKKFSDTAFSNPVDVAPTFVASAGDIFVDNNNVPHFTLNEISGNIFTGNVIYADSNNWNGYALLSSGDIYSASLVMDDQGLATLAAYRGNTYPYEEIVIYGPDNNVAVGNISKKDFPYKIISSENNLRVYFNENYSGRIYCSSIDGKIVFDQKGNFLKDEDVQINNLFGGVYIFSSENKFGKFVIKIVVK